MLSSGDIRDGIERGVLYVSPGDHVVDPIIARGRHLTIRGEGPQSRLTLRGGGETLLDFDGGQVGRDAPTLTLKDFSISTEEPAGSAVRARWGGRAFTQHRSLDVSRVTIGGRGKVETGGAFFKTGLRVENGANACIERLMAESGLAEDGVGVDLYTDQETHACEATIRDSTLTHFGTAVRCGGFFEGLHVTGSTVLSCITAVLLGAEHAGRPGVYITGNHFNFRTSGVYLQGAVQSFITGNLFYAQFGDGRRPYCAINTGSGQAPFPLDGKITGNTFVKLDDLAPDSYAIVVPGGPARENFIIDANHFTAWRHGIILQPGSNGVRVGRGNAYTAVEHEVVNLGDGNVIDSF